jgi:peptide/nickel transport system substrate-binding protein
MKSIAGRVPGMQIHASGGIGGVSTMMKIRMEGPLADVRVRRALAMAIDYPTLWQLGVEGFSMFPTMVPRNYYGRGFFLTPDQAGEAYAYNPAKAKELLKEAGYANGFTIQHNFYSNFGTYQDYALALQSMWKNIGVTLEVKNVDFVSYQANHYAGTWQGLLNTGACWIASCWGTADDAFSQFITGGAQNFAKISDPKIDDIYQRSRGELDPAKRRALLWEFDQYEASQVYFLRIGVATAWIMMQPWEMNGASHQTMWFTGFNGPTWLGMHDTSKYPGDRGK